MSLCIVDSYIGSVRPTEPWTLAQHTRRLFPGPVWAQAVWVPWALGSLGALGPGPRNRKQMWPAQRVRRSRATGQWPPLSLVEIPKYKIQNNK